MVTSQQVVLSRRPRGRLDSSMLDIEKVTIDEPSDNEVLVRNIVFSLDPYMRPRMDDERSYIEPFAVGAPLQAGAVGEVVASGATDVPVGTHVLHMAGWRDYALLPRNAVRRIEPSEHPLSYHLGVLGMPGLTAYAGLAAVAELAPEESIYISSAAGTVGALTGQMAKLMGAARVIGSTSSTKIDYVRGELGFDEVFDYRSAPVSDSLGRAAAGGIDVYFDNVGGDHFAAALAHLNDFGRVVMCGTISSYDDPDAKTVPGNLFNIVRKRLRVSGMYVNDHVGMARQFNTDVTRWLDEGRLTVREEVVRGIESAPEAFFGLLRGDYTGKVLVEL
ncbi:NADP-dependent oxidoreductase [Gordonia rubripertincta]|uniref:NADP-dependent oxidoreductase n=1 Tax=Gordonia rubripertincta TaxID=36822 RepID=A0ABT4MVQ2_GORRU|nr:NADP-dependent oxidoreductase [Gordonia rubripertincta]MCZ4551089.1 NADP-dependent oxidoreductase [Gordonia rubripertincta]